MVPLLRAEGGEEEPQVATEDGRPTEAETKISPLSPDEALVVDVTRGLELTLSDGLLGATRQRVGFPLKIFDQTLSSSGSSWEGRHREAGVWSRRLVV
jgi:hypothetical protein